MRKRPAKFPQHQVRKLIAVIVDFPQTLMEFQFPPLLPRRESQTPQAQPSLVTSTGRESVRLHSSVCSPAPASFTASKSRVLQRGGKRDLQAASAGCEVGQPSKHFLVASADVPAPTSTSLFMQQVSSHRHPLSVSDAETQLSVSSQILQNMQ